MSDLSHEREGTPAAQLPPQFLNLWETEIAPPVPRRLDEQARRLKAYQRSREIEQASEW